MDRAKTAMDTLQRIQQLWVEIRHAKLNSPEYKVLMEKIRTLSAEYQTLVDTPKEPEKQSRVTTH